MITQAGQSEGTVTSAVLQCDPQQFQATMVKARDAVDAAIVQPATCTPLELWRSMSPTAGTDAPADEATLSKLDMAHERATLLLSFVNKKHSNKCVAQARQVRTWPAHIAQGDCHCFLAC